MEDKDRRAMLASLIAENDQMREELRGAFDSMSGEALSKLALIFAEWSEDRSLESEKRVAGWIASTYIVWIMETRSANAARELGFWE
jgi:hypothetical protein